MVRPEAISRSCRLVRLAYQLQPTCRKEAPVGAHVPVPPAVVRTLHDQFQLLLRPTQIFKLALNQTAVDSVVDVRRALLGKDGQHFQSLISHGLGHSCN